MPVHLTVNGKSVTLDVDPDMPLLWAVRDVLGLTGTRFGCGVALCGACTVHLEGQPIRSCVTPVRAVQGKHVTTIEGAEGREIAALRSAWIELDVPQCGYCQSGQLMQAARLLVDKPRPTDADIDATMSGNVCRCAAYHRIRAGIHRAAELMGV